MNTSINQNMNPALNTPTRLVQPQGHTSHPAAQAAPTPTEGTPNSRTGTANSDSHNIRSQFRSSWPVIRAILVVWAVAVWLLLVLMPGVEQITDMTSAMLHLPNMLIGLALVGAMFAAYNLRSDGHMLWFLGVLLLLAGWM